MGTERLLPWLSAALALAVPLQALGEERPMSAIDWLSSSVATTLPAPGPGTQAVLPPTPGEEPVSTGVQIESVAMQSLSAAASDSLGLLPAARTGLPRNLWGETPEVQLAALLRKERLDTLPSIQAFLLELMLAELDPPQERATEGRHVLFLARIDRLLDMGALDQAMALLDQANTADPEIFRRQFDVALLSGQEDRACEIMEAHPAIAPSFPARIFCLARRDKWEDAALSLSTGRALGQINTAMAELLERFLDPELAEDAQDLPPPPRPSPLTFRLMEAIGQPMATTTLPLAFAQADLRANSGWKAQIEAAERLTRMGVIDPNLLFGLYTQDRASASGGVWERVALVSRLDSALEKGQTQKAALLLPALWQAMQSQELEPALALFFAPRLPAFEPGSPAAQIAFRLHLLTPDFEAAAKSHSPVSPDEQLMAGIAQGDTAGIRAQDQLGLALKRVFDTPPKIAPPAYAALLPNRLGEALLAAVDDISEGAKGDLRRLEAGLSLLRKAGLERVARRAALELLVLDRRG